jgi:hypothetical protein
MVSLMELGTEVAAAGLFSPQPVRRDARRIGVKDMVSPVMEGLYRTRPGISTGVRIIVMRSTVAKTTAYFLVAICLTWPSALVVGDAVPASAGTDVWNSLWSLSHWANSVAAGEAPWLTSALNFPMGGTLLVTDPVGATLVMPVVLMFGPAVGYTLLVWLQLTFAGLVAHMFASEFLRWRRGSGGPGWGPWVSGLSFMASPLLSSHVHNGATEAMSVGWTALAVWLVWRAAVHHTLRSVLAAALSLPLAAVAHWYGGVVAFVFAVIICVGGIGDGSSIRARGRWMPLGFGLLLTGLLAMSVLEVNDSRDSLTEIKTEEMVKGVNRTSGSADPLTYVMPGAHRSPDFRKISHHDEKFVHAHYLGFVLLGLCGWAGLRRRRHTGFLMWGGLACLLLSLGPVLIHNARPVLIAGDLAVPLPFFLLEAWPGFDSLSLPWKLALGPALALSLMAGVALDMRGRRMALGGIALILLEARWMSPAAELNTLVSTVSAPSLVALRDAPDGAVINYPLQPGRPYLFEQTVHGKPIAGMLNQVGNTQAMRLWGRIRTESRSDPDTFHQAVSSTAERLGIRYLVIHTDPDAEPDVYSSAVAELERLFEVPEWGRGQVRVVPLW